MNLSTFSRHLDKILSQDDLSVRYMQATNENLDEMVQDMHTLIQKNQIPDSDVDMVVRKSVEMAIETETSVLDILANKERIPTDITGSIGRYFDDVGKIYERNGNDMNIEYCPENRDKLIEMNTKAVIYIAKQYRNKGVDFEDLIGAGNLGLCMAFDKFKQNNKLEGKLRDIAEEFDAPDEHTKCIDGLDIVGAMSRHITYGELYNRLSRSFKKDSNYSKNDILAWVNKNVTSARFNSVATMWIRACILQEIKNASLVHRPDSERIRSKKETGVYNPDTYISIDRPVASDTDTTLENFLQSQEEITEILDTEDTRNTFRSLLERLLTGVSVRDRRIFLKKFGIGLPRSMQPKEIAEQEDLSIARVSQIFQQVLVTMKENADKMNIPSERIQAMIDKISE